MFDRWLLAKAKHIKRREEKKQDVGALMAGIKHNLLSRFQSEHLKITQKVSRQMTENVKQSLKEKKEAEKLHNIRESTVFRVGEQLNPYLVKDWKQDPVEMDWNRMAVAAADSNETFDLTAEDRDDLANTTGTKLAKFTKMTTRNRSRTEKPGSMDLKLEKLRFTMYKRKPKKAEEPPPPFPENATKPLDVRLHGIQTITGQCRLSDLRWARKTVQDINNLPK